MGINTSTEYRLPDKVDANATVAVEVNSLRHTIYFFVNGKPVPCVVTNLPAAVCLGFAATPGGVIKFVSLEKLPQDSVDASSSMVYKRSWWW